MARITSASLVLILAAIVSTINAAPLVDVRGSHQSSPECTDARSARKTALSSALSSLEELHVTDEATVAAVDKAKTALQSSQEAIDAITETAPVPGSGRGKVRQIYQGIRDAKEALEGASSSDAGVSNSLKMVEELIESSKNARKVCFPNGFPGSKHHSKECRDARKAKKAAVTAAMEGLEKIDTSDSTIASAADQAKTALQGSIDAMSSFRKEGRKDGSWREMRQKVRQGIEDAKAALEDTKSSDASVTESVRLLEEVIAAGKEAKAQCAPSRSSENTSGSEPSSSSTDFGSEPTPSSTTFASEPSTSSSAPVSEPTP
ncbi:hypothetical protein HGRIS_000750 [Hohenbuehelia grisea]|uniref:Uncharacterized protein n=1 Tax=Hohenbuehelia grisea TaxID=104357 RepID=A0ABR3IPQ0_9AGAR